MGTIGETTMERPALKPTEAENKIQIDFLDLSNPEQAAIYPYELEPGQYFKLTTVSADQPNDRYFISRIYPRLSKIMERSGLKKAIGQNAWEFIPTLYDNEAEILFVQIVPRSIDEGRLKTQS